VGSAVDPDLWTFLRYGPFPDRERFAAHVPAPATEAISLLTREAFEGLHVRRLEWKCDASARPCAPPGAGRTAPVRPARRRG